MALVLRGAVWEGFLSEGTLEDFCLKEKSQGGWLCGPVSNIYTLYYIIYSQTLLIIMKIREKLK